MKTALFWGNTNGGHEERGRGVVVVVGDAQIGDEADGGHVRRADRLDLVDSAESLLSQQLVKVGDDLVQQAQALDALNSQETLTYSIVSHPRLVD